MPAAATMPTPAAAVAVPIHHPQEDEVYVPLPMKQFDITPGCGAICCINEKLILGDPRADILLAQETKIISDDALRAAQRQASCATCCWRGVRFMNAHPYNQQLTYDVTARPYIAAY